MAQQTFTARLAKDFYADRTGEPPYSGQTWVGIVSTFEAMSFLEFDTSALGSVTVTGATLRIYVDWVSAGGSPAEEFHHGTWTPPITEADKNAVTTLLASVTKPYPAGWFEIILPATSVNTSGDTLIRWRQQPNYEHQIEAEDHTNTYPPELVVDYTAGGSVTVTPGVVPITATAKQATVNVPFQAAVLALGITVLTATAVILNNKAYPNPVPMTAGVLPIQWVRAGVADTYNIPSAYIHYRAFGQTKGVISSDGDPTIGGRVDIEAGDRIIFKVANADLGTLFPDNATLKLSVLHCCRYDGEPPTTEPLFAVRKVTQQGLDISNCDWNNYAAGSPWTTPGGEFEAGNYGQIASEHVFVNGVGNYSRLGSGKWASPMKIWEIDITQMVLDAKAAAEDLILCMENIGTDPDTVTEFHGLGQDPYQPDIEIQQAQDCQVTITGTEYNRPVITATSNSYKMATGLTWGLDSGNLESDLLLFGGGDTKEIGAREPGALLWYRGRSWQDATNVSGRTGYVIMPKTFMPEVDQDTSKSFSWDDIRDLCRLDSTSNFGAFVKVSGAWKFVKSTDSGLSWSDAVTGLAHSDVSLPFRDPATEHIYYLSLDGSTVNLNRLDYSAGAYSHNATTVALYTATAAPDLSLADLEKDTAGNFIVAFKADGSLRVFTSADPLVTWTDRTSLLGTVTTYDYEKIRISRGQTYAGVNFIAVFGTVSTGSPRGGDYHFHPDLSSMGVDWVNGSDSNLRRNGYLTRTMDTDAGGDIPDEWTCFLTFHVTGKDATISRLGNSHPDVSFNDFWRDESAQSYNLIMEFDDHKKMLIAENSVSGSQMGVIAQGVVGFNEFSRVNQSAGLGFDTNYGPMAIVRKAAPIGKWIPVLVKSGVGTYTYSKVRLYPDPSRDNTKGNVLASDFDTSFATNARFDGVSKIGRNRFRAKYRFDDHTDMASYGLMEHGGFFYTKVNNVLNEVIQVEIEQDAGIGVFLAGTWYRTNGGMMAPMGGSAINNAHWDALFYTYDPPSQRGRRWERIWNVHREYDGERGTGRQVFQTPKFSQNTVYFAPVPVYGIDEFNADWAVWGLDSKTRLCTDADFGNVKAWDKTGAQVNSIIGVEIDDSSVPKSQKTLFVLCGVEDASEQTSQWMWRAIVEELLSGSQLAQSLLQKHTFMVIPFVNQEGVRDGVSRYAYDPDPFPANNYPNALPDPGAYQGMGYSYSVLLGLENYCTNWVNTTGSTIAAAYRHHCDTGIGVSGPSWIHFAPYLEIDTLDPVKFRDPTTGFDSEIHPEFYNSGVDMPGSRLPGPSVAFSYIRTNGGADVYIESPWRSMAHKWGFYPDQADYTNYGIATMTGFLSTLPLNAYVNAGLASGTFQILAGSVKVGVTVLPPTLTMSVGILAASVSVSVTVPTSIVSGTINVLSASVLASVSMTAPALSVSASVMGTQVSSGAVWSAAGLALSAGIFAPTIIVPPGGGSVSVSPSALSAVLMAIGGESISGGSAYPAGGVTISALLFPASVSAGPQNIFYAGVIPIVVGVLPALVPSLPVFPWHNVLQYQVEGGFQTTILETPGGAEQRSPDHDQVKMNFYFRFDGPLSDIDSVWDFYIARKGAFEPFILNNPADGQVYAVRFAQDNLSFDQVKTLLFSQGIQLTGYLYSDNMAGFR